MPTDKITLELGQDAAYVSLPDHPGHGIPGVAKEQVRLRDIYPNYKGPDLHFDFDANHCLIGADILL